MKKSFISINAAKTCGHVSDTLFGLFWEDINNSCDGGINANMVRNYSFDDRYLKERKLNEFIDLTMGRIKSDEHLETEVDPLRFWNCIGGKLTAATEAPVSRNSGYVNIAVKRIAKLENLGYNGRHRGECAMSILSGMQYNLSLYIRSSDFIGKITAFVQDGIGRALTETAEIPVTANWEQPHVVLQGIKSAYGKLVISFEGTGSVDLDAVMLYSDDYWGKDDPKWSQGLLRGDLVEALRDLNPKFLRFPGGCIVEGLDINNEYHWKDSVGRLTDRKSNYNLWDCREKNYGYSQSYQIGFYELFLLCEDLKMEPVPVVWAGMNCQLRRRGMLDMDSEAFRRDVIQNALDLIEYANGDPAVSPWAKLRAEAGHPEPFNMKYISIGNENFGEDYLVRFRAVKKAINEKYPGMICILSYGSDPNGKDSDCVRKEARKDFPDVYVDEHFFGRPSWFIKQASRYDNFSRDGAKIFLGEWAAYDAVKGALSKNFVSNTYGTALAEAAFLTGLERNSDVVVMTSYAPLLAMIDGDQWQHNLIWFNPAHVLKTPNYYVQQMFSTTVGKNTLDMDRELPKGVFASATSDEGYVCLKVVNTTKNPCSIDLDVNGFAPEMVKQTVLHADKMKDVNELAFKGIPVETIKPKVVVKSLTEMRTVTVDAQSVNVFQFYFQMETC